MLKPKKSLGQHFLTDLLIAEDVARTTPGVIPETVIEVGPGQGVLTGFLFKEYGSKLCLVEKDERCISLLKASFPSLEIKNVDFLNEETDPVEFRIEEGVDWKERLQRWPGSQLTHENKCMISSDAILTIVEPQQELLEAYKEVIGT